METQKIIEQEITFQCSKSTGPGGQNVNKRNTKVQLFFNFDESKYLGEEEKEELRNYYPEGIIIITSHEERSQLQNKENAITKLKNTLEDHLTLKKERIDTNVPYREKEKRYVDKTRQGDKKKERSKKINLDNE